MSKHLKLFSALCLAGLILVAGCYVPGGPVPEGKHPPAPQAWTILDVNAAVSMSMEKIYSPAPTTNGTPPEEANYLRYLRFRPKGDTGSIKDADAIIVLIPGGQAGASYMEIICSQMVYMALTQRNQHIEVLVYDRRPNNLEDLTGVNAAEEAHDTQVAIDYYYHGAEIDGHTFAGFEPDLPCLSEFGVELLVKDIYTLITTSVPDPEMRRQKVFLGGHSMGGPFTNLFAGWDFDGNPATLDDAGYRNCAGLIGLDTLIQTSIPFTDTYGTEAAGLDPPASGEEEYFVNFLEGLRKGYIPRVILSSTLLSPEIMAIEEILAMEAVWHPDEESDLLDRIPYSDSAALTIKLLHSRSLENFLTNVPSIQDFRFTNEAAFGCVVDDNFEPMIALQASFGFLNGGPVVRKEFPLPEDLANLPWLNPGGSIDMDGKFIANDAGSSYFQLGTGPLYTWANFDEIGDGADPNYSSTDGTLTYTTAEKEVSDVTDVARSMFESPTNALEWYFTTRIWVDVWASEQAFSTKYGYAYLHKEKIDSIPRIEFIAGDGPMHAMIDTLPPEVRVLKGYNHLDVLTAAPDRPSRRPNEVIDPLLDFVQTNAE